MVCLYDPGGGVGRERRMGFGAQAACGHVGEMCFLEAMGRVLIVRALALHLVTGACGCMEFRRTPTVP